MEDTTTKIVNYFEPNNGYLEKTENANENATNHLEVSFSGRPNTNVEENGNSEYYKQTNTCRILQRKLELKVEKAKRSYNQYQDTCSKKSQSSSLIPISRLQIPGYVENQPLVDYKSESDDQEEISFFPLKLKSTKKQELSDTFSIQEIAIESEDNNSDDSDTSVNLELLPPRLKTNLLDKVLNCFYCVQGKI
ncbi:uncharacterized protein LOC129942056 [Eupeodes corollae]|uniref:uncharacterized protein LOC129942056 n=1 Tax=Eupeodes corollae TaxID=290404 RepID=UPI002490E2AF|nr:uncharacterized protein LOC129942056 [Eupeodes corollae]